MTISEAGQMAKHFLALFTMMEKRMEKRERAQRQWLTDTAHELRTPLAVLRAEIEALQDGVHEANDQTLAILHAQVLRLCIVMDDKIRSHPNLDI